MSQFDRFRNNPEKGWTRFDDLRKAFFNYSHWREGESSINMHYVTTHELENLWHAYQLTRKQTLTNIYTSWSNALRKKRSKYGKLLRWRRKNLLNNYENIFFLNCLWNGASLSAHFSAKVIASKSERNDCDLHGNLRCGARDFHHA